MMVSGHKTRSVFDRYNIVSEDDLKEAARKTWARAQSQDKTTNVVSIIIRRASLTYQEAQNGYNEGTHWS
jgi:hypothetical protein